MSTPRTLLLFAISTAIVVAVFAWVAVVSEWWVLPVAVAIHLAGFAAVMAVMQWNLKQEDKPDPLTEARLQEEAVEEKRSLRRDGARR